MCEQKFPFDRIIVLLLSSLLCLLNVGCQSQSEVKQEKNLSRGDRESPEEIDSIEEIDSNSEPLDSVDQKLDSAHFAYRRKEYDKARSILDSLNDTEFSDAQQFYYDNIAADIRRAKAIEEYDRNLPPKLRAAQREYKAFNFDKAESLLNSIDPKTLTNGQKRHRDSLLESIGAFRK